MEKGSFTAAGRLLGVPTSTVSRAVSRLEERLGARLLQRTTRRLNLTDAGRIYFERAAGIVAEAEAADRAVLELQSEPSGRIRFTAPLDFTGRFWRLVSEFLTLHPKVEVDMEFTERNVNLIEEGFDVAIRGGGRPDTASFISRKLVDMERVLVASPAYLESRGEPDGVAALRTHDCVLLSAWSPNSAWTLCGPKGDLQVPVRGRVQVNDMAGVRRAALDGFGIAQVVRSACEEDLSAGRLREVLPGRCNPGGSLWVLYPSRKHLAASVRAFVEFAVERYPRLP